MRFLKIQVRAYLQVRIAPAAGRKVSMQWKGGKMQTADIHSLKGGAIKLRSGQKTATITIKPGQTVHLNTDLVAAN